jgi:acid phosphatase (class A)
MAIRSRVVKLAGVGALAGLLLTCVVAVRAADTTERAPTSMYAVAHVQGYLQPDERPDGLLLAPPPPAPGTARYAADVEGYKSTRALRDTPRWRLAAIDADVNFPHAADTFSCALGVRIDATTTPSLYELLQRTVIDAGQSTYPAKEKYQRPRPYAVFNDPICVPEDAERLRTNSSYPSGHASLGWVWALLLAELAPDRADAVMARGYAFGESRVVCGVHWPSDIEAGRTIASAVFAKLHSKPQFVGRMQAARDELRRARSSAMKHAPDCALERAALGERPATTSRAARDMAAVASGRAAR